jgi:peptidoglycan/xylan/chitin deacetylase (PgdA/CDA1 family)
MQRRTIFGIVSLTLLLGGLAVGQEPRPDRQIAVTFDDLPFGGPDLGLSRIRAENEAILATLRKEGVPATGFVNEGKLYVAGEIDARTALLEKWLSCRSICFGSRRGR